MEQKLTAFLIPLMSLWPLIPLTECSRILVKLTVVKMVKKLLAFHETERSMKNILFKFYTPCVTKIKAYVINLPCIYGRGKNCLNPF